MIRDLFTIKTESKEIEAPTIPDNITRPDNFMDIDLTLTPDQSRLLKAFMDDIRGKQNPVIGFMKMKYWFLRTWEAGQKEGDVDRELVNQWREKKKEIDQFKRENGSLRGYNG